MGAGATSKEHADPPAMPQGWLADAYREMDRFGARLGEALAVRIMQSTPAETAVHRAACALECVLESLGVHFTVQQATGELSYTLDLCPLCEKSAQSGLKEVELAHHGLNALCTSLIRSLDPGLKVRLPASPTVAQIFSVSVPGSA